MKKLIILLIIGLLSFIQINAQFISNTLPQKTIVSNTLFVDYVPAISLFTTFIIVNNMNVPPHYMYNMEMQHIRDRQRFTVALTGIAISTTIFFIKERYKKHR